MLKSKRRNIFIFVFIFFIIVVTYFFVMGKYINDTQLNFTNTIRDEIQIFIRSKKSDTFYIAKNFAQNKKLIKVMQEKNYDALYTPNFFEIPKEYLAFKNIKIHVVDKDGKQRFFSWTKKDLGSDVLQSRNDLAELFKSPHPTASISVGKFSIAFKGIMPIYDDNHNFLGIIEAITYFNSISKKLQNNNIYSIVAIDKKYTPQLKYAFSKHFIDGYNIAMQHIPQDVKKILKEKKLESFLFVKNFTYVKKNNSIFHGYFVISVPIYDNNKKLLAYYLAFIEDKYHLVQQEFFLRFLILIMGGLFLYMFYLVKKEYQYNHMLITDLDKKVEEQTQEKLRLLYIDTQTGAYKKLKFDEDKEQFINAKVVMLNLRNFSKINESYGFEIGDKILNICVHRLKNILHTDIYRLNADEFLFFSYNPKQEIKQIKNEFSHSPIKISKYNISIRISFSFGVAKASLEKVISKLSIAVHQAKKHPFSDFMYYREKPMDDSFIRFNSLLYDAIFEEKEAFILPYFQGIYNNETKKITKYEALARLQVKEKVYSPYFFIEIAKSSGFIHEITKIMIDKSCAYLATLPEKDIELSLNITESDLATKQLREFLITTVKKYHINPKRITLEVLEGITSTGTKNNIKQLKQLKDLGFKLAIDDFGVEYSNFERLSEIEVDFIKIDGKYIKTIDTNPKSLKIAKAISDFSHSMGVKVVAEFVEDEAIQAIIEELGIEYSQGYYFSQPQATIEILR